MKVKDLKKMINKLDDNSDAVIIDQHNNLFRIIGIVDNQENEYEIIISK